MCCLILLGNAFYALRCVFIAVMLVSISLCKQAIRKMRLLMGCGFKTVNSNRKWQRLLQVVVSFWGMVSTSIRWQGRENFYEGVEKGHGIKNLMEVKFLNSLWKTMEKRERERRIKKSPNVESLERYFLLPFSKAFGKLTS